MKKSIAASAESVGAVVDNNNGNNANGDFTSELRRGFSSSASLAGLDVGVPEDEPFPIKGLDEQIANNMIE
jgi:hypothetical protein